MMFFKKIYSIGDKIEDKIRGFLSHFPIIYAFVGGIGLVIFWRGVWHTADFIMEVLFAVNFESSSTNISGLPWWDGPLSLVIGTALLLCTGLFVSGFIGNEIIISGLKHEKKTSEKTEKEIAVEAEKEKEIEKELHKIDEKITNLET